MLSLWNSDSCLSGKDREDGGVSLASDRTDATQGISSPCSAGQQG